MVSSLSVGISIGMAILGLRGLWKLQHALTVKGYMLQAGAFLASLSVALIGYYLPNTFGTILFDCGVILIGAFLFIPDIIYYLLKYYYQ